MTNQEAIIVLSELKNKSTDEKLIEAYDIAIKSLTKKVANKPECLLPCKCGCKRRQHWFGFNENRNVILKCSRCGFEASGKNEMEARRAWNKAIKE